jgi:1-acyl-sn-glycerol-3-phosphate acyltransferase
VRGSILYRAAAVVFIPLVRLLFRPRVEGLEHVPAGGLVLASNHLSALDVWALGYALRGRWVRSMAKPQLFRRRVLGWFLRGAGAFRAGPDAAARAAALARDGHAVCVFPEGARRRPDRTHPPRTGAARAALDAGVPLVPAAVRGTDRAKRFAQWEIVFGPPIPLGDLGDVAPQRAARLATERLWAAIESLAGR